MLVFFLKYPHFRESFSVSFIFKVLNFQKVKDELQTHIHKKNGIFTKRCNFFFIFPFKGRLYFSALHNCFAFNFFKKIINDFIYLII